MTEVLQQSLFYLFAFLAIVFACLVVTMNNPVRSALALVFVFFASAGIWLLSHKEFLALILVLVYVGAVMTLFLFVVMMLNVDIESIKKHFFYSFPLALLILAALVGFMIQVIPSEWLYVSKAVETGMTNTEALGSVLYTDYLLGFEIAAILLLVAIIAAISLALRTKPRGKKQDIVQQIMTSKEERLRVIKLSPTTNERGES